MATDSIATHGDRRNRRWVWNASPARKWVDRDGNEIELPTQGGFGQDREEFYCQVHGWIDYGFLGGMLWTVEHETCKEEG